MSFGYQLLIALCLAVVLEGMLYAAFPTFMKRLIAEVLTLPEGQVRAAGLVAAVAGLVALWFLL